MLVLDVLPKHLWLPTHTALWHVCAATTARFSPAQWPNPPSQRRQPGSGPSRMGTSTSSSSPRRPYEQNDAAYLPVVPQRPTLQIIPLDN